MHKRSCCSLDTVGILRPSSQLTAKMLSSFLVLLSAALVAQAQVAQSPVSAIPIISCITHPSYSSGVNVSSVSRYGVAIHSNTDIGGGEGWTGPTTCVDGAVCVCINTCMRFDILFVANFSSRVLSMFGRHCVYHLDRCYRSLHRRRMYAI